MLFLILVFSTAFSGILAELDGYEKFAEECHEILGTPLITPTTRDVTVKPGDKITFKCVAKEPITWQPWNYFKGEYTIEHIHNADKKIPYEAILNLEKITFEYVGSFYCVKNESLERKAVTIEELEEDFQASRITLFVDDPDHPLADKIINDGFNIPRYTNAYIPCKPTSKSIEIEMFEEINYRLADESQYDPTQGYLEYMYDNMKFSCKVKGREETLKNFYVTAWIPSKRINKILITSTSGYFGTEGETTTLNCNVHHNILYPFVDLKWSIPKDRKIEEDNRMSVTETIKDSFSGDRNYYHQLYDRNLTITNLNAQKDSGVYGCKVKSNNTDIEKDIESDKIRIKILGKDVGVLYLYEPNEKLQKPTNLKEEEVKLRVAFKGYPRPDLTWYNNNKKEIKASPDDEKYTVDTKKGQTVLTIKNPKESDLGEYTLKAKNKATEKEFTIKLIRSE